MADCAEDERNVDRGQVAADDSIMLRFAIFMLGVIIGYGLVEVVA